jgi:hypothetical protein
MALITSAATGNFSAGATWTGGVVPTVGDEARASTGHTVTIDVNTTCDEVSNAGTGIFTLASGVTLTANVTHKSATVNRNLLQFTAASPAVGAIVGNILGATVSSSSVYGAVINTSSGALTITGNVTGGTGAVAMGANNNSSGSLTVTGNVTASSAASSYGIYNASTGSITITGNVTGGSGSTAPGAQNQTTGILTINGIATGGTGSSAHGVNNISTGNVFVTRAVGNAFGPGNTAGLSSATGANNTSTGIIEVQELEFGQYGMSPVLGTGIRLKKVAGNLVTFPYVDAGSAKTLVDATTGQMPAAADVRSGTVYADGALTGVLAVPAAASVAFGVPVDATTGTAALTPASVWDHLLTAITASSTIGTLLKTNIDATISSRSTATTAGIADAVWDEVLTGSAHNIATSAGRRLRILDEERIIAEGQTVSATTNTITLEPIGTLCVGQTIVVTDQDTDEKQVRFILAFDTGTDTATVDSNWCVVPTAGDEYLLTTVRDPLVTRGDHPTGTVGAEIDEMYLIHGLKDGEVLTVTPTSRTAGVIAQTISGDGTTTTTVSRD